MNLRASIIFATLLVLTTTACNPCGKSESVGTPLENQAKTFYQIGKIKQEFKDGTKDKADKFAESIELPTIESKSNPDGVSVIKKVFDAAIAVRIAEAKASIKKSAGEEYGYSRETTFSVPYQTDKVLVINRCDSYYGEGAAHGNPVLSSEIWDIETQTSVPGSPFNAFGPKLIVALDKLIKRRIGATCSNNSFSSLKREPLAGWYPNEKGLVLYWHPYQIASYADGFVETQFSTQEIAPYLSSPAKDILDKR